MRVTFQAVAGAAAALVLLLLAPATLKGGTLTVTSLDSTRGGNVAFRVNGNALTTYAGAILGTYDGVNVSPFFCVDLFTDITFGNYASAPTAASSALREGRVAWLYVNLISSITTAVKGEAFQLAIWDIIHDGGDGLSAGSIRSSSGTPTLVRNAWAGYLSASLGQSILTGNYFYRNYSLADGLPRQNFVGAAPPPPPPVPEPATYVLMATGLAMVLFGARRKARAERR